MGRKGITVGSHDCSKATVHKRDKRRENAISITVAITKTVQWQKITENLRIVECHEKIVNKCIDHDCSKTVKTD